MVMDKTMFMYLVLAICYAAAAEYSCNWRLLLLLPVHTAIQSCEYLRHTAA